MRRIQARVSRTGEWFAARPVTTCLLAVTAVISVGYWTDEQNDQEIRDLATCGQEYVEASNAANAPIREAAAALDEADDAVWHSAQLVFSQEATQTDYLELRRSIVARNRLSDELKQAREENPPPAPPEAFCAGR